MVTVTVREEKANSLLPFPAIVHVFSFIWFLLLHKSLLMILTLRRTALSPTPTRCAASYGAHGQG